MRKIEPVDGGEQELLGFEALTLAPIDRRLVDKALLTDEEQTWVDAYHMRVRNEIGPLVDGAAREWLTAVTAPLGV